MVLLIIAGMLAIAGITTMAIGLSRGKAGGDLALAGWAFLLAGMLLLMGVTFG